MPRILVLLLLVVPSVLWGQAERFNGLSLVSERYVLDTTHVDPMISVNANYAAVIPFCFMPTVDSGKVIYNHNQQWVGERLEGARKATKALKVKGIDVMVKPQIWVGHGIFTGNIKMKNEENWLQFEKEYSAYIIAFAKMAEEEGAGMFCIGTELKEVVANRPELFTRLIKEVREVYSGKLTYAANWDSYLHVKFWKQLDFIGIDAYFPITKQAKPKLKDLIKGWESWLPQLDSIHSATDRKIIFTEYGYRSIRKCAAKPWDYGRSDKDRHDQKCQAMALKALYETVWKKDYFAGGFLWKWYPDNENAGGVGNNMFTIQNKKAEHVVKKQYSLIKN